MERSSGNRVATSQEAHDRAPLPSTFPVDAAGAAKKAGAACAVNGKSCDPEDRAIEIAPCWR